MASDSCCVKETTPCNATNSENDKQDSQPVEHQDPQSQKLSEYDRSSTGVSGSEFLTKLDAEMYEYFQEISQELQNLFGISRAEAVARINERWGDVLFDPFPDIVCHEYPEHWAYEIYYDRTDYLAGIPYWDEHADRSTWPVLPAPPRDTLFWTVKECDERLTS
jgi:hypothetical protein